MQVLVPTDNLIVRGSSLFSDSIGANWVHNNGFELQVSFFIIRSRIFFALNNKLKFDGTKHLSHNVVQRVYSLTLYHTAYQDWSFEK